MAPTRKEEQRIKFMVKAGERTSEISETFIKVYVGSALKPTAVFKWVKRFSEGAQKSLSQISIKMVLGLVD